MKWANKFDHPTKKALLAEMDKEQGSLFDKAYQELADATGSSPSLTWMGLPWCWSYAYACPSSALIETVYLLPDPNSPKIALSIRSTFFEQNPPDTLHKALHAGIASGVLINHQTWCQWEIAPPELLGPIVDLIRSACNPK
ncbi:MAG: hypothetical protein JKY96_04880 [Phycisphaerales bacterium]|nr:hypothetical protein [Phycisphaerales bacterium]